MTAIIYEIKHNSARRTNGTALHHGTVSLPLSLSFLFEPFDSDAANAANKYFEDFVEHNLFFITPPQTNWNTCQLCNLRVICARGSAGSLAKLFDLRCFPRHGVRNAGVRTVCLRSGALACSQQLLQMVCSLCHLLSQRCQWRAINQQHRHRQACFASKMKMKEVDCGSRSFITLTPPSCEL